MAKVSINEKIESFKSAVLNKNWNPRYSMQHVTFCLKVKNINETPQILWEKRVDPLVLSKDIPKDVIESIDSSVKNLEAYPVWKLIAVLFEPGYSRCVMIDYETDEPYIY